MEINSKLNLTQPKGVTPMIIEETEMRGHHLSVFDRLMKDRIIMLNGEVTPQMATTVNAQLLYLDSVSNEDIEIYINSPGGCVYSGLSMLSVMDYIKSDIRTVNIGMAASMGAVLLSAGTKGKRHALKYSNTMLHQSSGGTGGNIQDAEVSYEQWKKLNSELLTILAENCGKTEEELNNDTIRDLWLWPEKAVEYGIIDNIISKK